VPYLECAKRRARRSGDKRPPEAKAFFVNECLNFDVLVTAKIPYQKIGSAEKKGAGASPPS